MKSIKNIALGSILALASFGVITMSSCKKDDKSCDVGYEGSDCKTLSRDKFIGQWKGDETCTVGTDNYTVTLTAGSSSDLTLVYSNVYNDNYTATGTITGTNGFTFSGTGAGNVTFNGTATLNSGILSVDYKIMTNGALTNTCTFKGTKL